MLTDQFLNASMQATARADAEAEADSASQFRGLPRPVFIIGSLRSGASLLALCLGQHPNIRQVADNDWLGNFTVRLQQSFRDGTVSPATSQLAVSDVEIEEFFARFGETVNHLMLGASPAGRAPSTDAGPNGGYHPQRWIDATPGNSRLVFPLTRLFPAGKFIHVLRDVGEVVASLTDEHNRAAYKSQSIHMSLRDAYDHWRTSVLACVAAEQAFGSETVLRIRRADLVEQPEATIRRCLDFIDEPFAVSCLRPFR